MIAVAIVTVVVFVFNDFVFGEIIFGPTRTDFITFQWLCQLSDITCIDSLPFKIQSRKVLQQFTTHVTSAFVIGIIGAFPYIFWEVWQFVSPGLHARERNTTRGTIFFVSLLFFIGVTFGYLIVSPLSMSFMANYQLFNDPGKSIENIWEINSIISFITMISLACGLMFQLPIVIYFLTKVGLVTPMYLKKYRKHAIVIFLFASAVLTPPDPISQVFVSVPLILLYQLSIFISKRVYKQYLKKLNA